MEVHTFEKTLEVRLQEISEILETCDVKSDFRNFIEATIEPLMWNAIWRIPKATCQDLGIKFPTEVFGMVNQVYFDDLKADFTVTGVPDDSISLSESNMIPLEELYPTKFQIEKCVNAELTADIIDQYRFFQKYVWMPWDDEEGTQWKKENQLEPRIMLYYDLKNKNMSKKMSSHIRCLIHEAKYVQKQRENLELLIDNEDSDNEDGMLDEQNESVKKLMKLHYRLRKIKAEFEFLVNPTVRKSFDLQGSSGNQKMGDKQYFAISGPGNLRHHLEFLDKLKEKIPGHENLCLSENLQEALARSGDLDEVYLSSGQHFINFLEYLNNHLVSGFCPYKFSKDDYSGNLAKNYSIINTKDNDCFLLAIDGDVTLENLVIDCENVGTGILIKDGNVKVKNCLIYCHSKLNMIEGISVLGDASLTIENSVIRNFSLGISVQNGGKLIMKDSLVIDCNNALQSNGKCTIQFNGSSILDSEEFGLTKLVRDFESDKKTLVFEDLGANMEKLDLSLSGNCRFEGNKKGNAVIYNTANYVCEATSFIESDNSDEEM